MTNTKPASDFSAEELQRIRSLHVGGFGSLDSLDLSARRFHGALDLLLPRVEIALSNIKDPYPRRGRPSALSLHRRRIARCQLFREFAYGAAQAASRMHVMDRNAKRKLQRRRRKELRKATNIDAVKYQHAVESGGLTIEQLIQEVRAERRAAVDDYACYLREVLGRRTNLNHTKRDLIVGEILGALQMSSHSPDAVRQRFRRMRSASENR